MHFFDAILSFATLIGIIVTLAFHISIDGILGALISLFIIKTSVEILFEASNEILGCTADRELMRKIKDLICGLTRSVALMILCYIAMAPRN